MTMAINEVLLFSTELSSKMIRMLRMIAPKFELARVYCESTCMYVLIMPTKFGRSGHA